MPCAAWRHRCQIPDFRAGRPALPSFPRFPLGRIPSSVVRDFYCQSAGSHKAFPREVQDSFFIHRTSTVYPLCTATFHRAVHRSVHRSCGLRTGRLCCSSAVTRDAVGTDRGPPCQPGGHRSLELASICRMSWAAWRPRGLKHGGINRTKLVLGGTRRDISRPRCAQNGINRPPKCTSDGKCRRCRFARPGPRDIWGLCPRHREVGVLRAGVLRAGALPEALFLHTTEPAAARSAFLAEYRARVPGSATRAAHMRGERRCWSGA
jgi:hypothetical protein